MSSSALNAIVSRVKALKPGGEATFKRLGMDGLRVIHVLKQEGYLRNYRVDPESGACWIKCMPEGSGKLDLNRVSLASHRRHVDVEELSKMWQSFAGEFILSTPKGVLTAREARKHGVGGEVLLNVRIDRM